MTPRFLYKIDNRLQTQDDRLVTLAFRNLAHPGDDGIIGPGETYIYGLTNMGSKIPQCDSEAAWVNRRIVIFNRDAGFWINLFVQNTTISYILGENAAYTASPAHLGPLDFDLYATLTIARDGGLWLAPTSPRFNRLRPNVVSIVNRLDFAVQFNSPELDNALAIAPRSLAQIPQIPSPAGLIPECDTAATWATQRLTITARGGQSFALSIFTQYGDIYYALDSSDYPSVLRPIPGGVSQYDRLDKVLILHSPTHVEMQDRSGEPLTDKPSPPPVSAYFCGASEVPSAHTVIAGYFDQSLWGYALNDNAQKAMELSKNQRNNGPYVYVQNAYLPFQRDPAWLASWMTRLWDYWQYLGGPYVGLRAKWFSNIAIPETHDSMAVMTKDSWLDQIPAAQDRLFREQLFGGMRSFDMRYVWENALKQYVGNHYNDFEESTMDGCVAALKEFFRGSSEERCHEFIILKLRYGTGDNNETPKHTDADAIRMFQTFIEKLRTAGLAERILQYKQDASGTPLHPAKLPITTLEKLNVNTSSEPPSYKNLLLTVLPDRLREVINSSTQNDYEDKPAYFWAGSDVQTPGNIPFAGPGHGNLQSFGLSIVGIDRNDNLGFDYPGYASSNILASSAVDCMLYNPTSTFLQQQGNAYQVVMTSQNAYGSPYNYNFIAANFFEATPFVNNVIQLNILNDRTDVYAIDASTNSLSLVETDGKVISTVTRTIAIEPGTYYGSLQLAAALQAAFPTGWSVDFYGQFSITAPQGTNLRYSLQPTPLSRLLGFKHYEHTSLEFDAVLIAKKVRSPEVHYLDSDRGLEVFAVGTDRSLVYARQTVDCGAWSDLQSLGGVIMGEIAVARNAAGRLEVFVPGTQDTLYHQWQQPDGSWSGWSLLAADLRGNPAVVRDAAGCLHVFATGVDAHVYHLSQETPGGKWSGRHDLQGHIIGAPTAVLNADGHLEVFAIRPGNILQHTWQTPPGQTDSGWSGWQDLDASRQVVGRVAVARNRTGTVEVFARAADDHSLLHTWQTVPAAGPWSGWQSLQGILTSDPTVVSNEDGRLEVFVRGTGNTLYHRWQTVPASGPWSDWHSLNGNSNITSAAAVAMNSDGRLEVFARGFNNALYHVWQQLPGGPWSGWKSLGVTPLAGTPVCAPPHPRGSRWYAVPGAPSEPEPTGAVSTG